jgi:hypothetical protein
MRYDFQFSDPNPTTAPGYKNLDTILSYGLGAQLGPIVNVGDARQNFTQTYRVARFTAGTLTVGGVGLLVPPPNVGGQTTPFYNDTSGRAVSGYTGFPLDTYTSQTISPLSTGEASWAGSREDGFYADTPGIFDLLDPRILGSTLGQAGGGVDGFKGFNVLSYALQIPVASLPSFPYNAPFFGQSTGVGVYASVSRPRITLRSTIGDPVSSGPYIQVNRLGNPLFNEVLVALRDKDNYNRTSPTVDSAQFGRYALNPEIALLINVVFGTSFATTGRTDLHNIFIPDVLRVDTTTPPVKLAGQIGFSRLSFIGADITSGITPAGGTASRAGGWPNGRRLGDDVVDIALTAVASGPGYSSIVIVGDNVAANDQVYNFVFPYGATPHAGPRNTKDSSVNVGY